MNRATAETQINRIAGATKAIATVELRLPKSLLRFRVILQFI